MKIEIKNIKIASHLSEETNAFTADIYVDGVKTGYARNDGRGGCTDYNRYEGKMELLKKAEEFCLTLPPRKFPACGQMKAFEMPMNLEEFIDEAIDNEIHKKELKKLDKKMSNRLIFGTPDRTGDFYEVTFKVPLKDIPTVQLQGFVDKYKKSMETSGMVLWNTNLEAMGIKI